MDEQYINDIVKAVLGYPDAPYRAKVVVDVVSKGHSVDGILSMINDYHLSKHEIDDCACLAAVRGNYESYIATVKAGATCSASDVKVIMRQVSEQDKPSIVKTMVSYGLQLDEELLDMYCTPDGDSI